MPVLLVFPEMASGNWSDEDWGSAGPACIFSIGVCVATGKDGIAYPIKTANLGGTTPADLGNAKANCAKLAAPPVWLTMSPGPVDPCPANPTTLNFFPWGDTAHLHMTPVQFFDPRSQILDDFRLGRKFPIAQMGSEFDGNSNYIAQSHEFASADVRGNPPGGMPGGFCSGSSNGADPDSRSWSARFLTATPTLSCEWPIARLRRCTPRSRRIAEGSVGFAALCGQVSVQQIRSSVIDGGQIYVPNYNGGVDLYHWRNRRVQCGSFEVDGESELRSIPHWPMPQESVGATNTFVTKTQVSFRMVSTGLTMGALSRRSRSKSTSCHGPSSGRRPKI